jgi:hypothetical protein
MAKKKKQKQWKEKVEKRIDIGDRDGVSMIFNNELFIAGKDYSHAMLVSEVIYGIYIDEGDYDSKRESLAKNGGVFFRSDLRKNGDDRYVLYGQLVGDNMYWDDIKSRSETIEILSNVNKNDLKGYNHFYYEKRTGKITKIF